MYSDVYIFHSGNDPNDKAFARTIAEKILHFSIPHLIDVDELEREDANGEMRVERFVGVPIYIISPSMLRDAEYRRKLVIGTLGRNSPWHCVFYICRGVEFKEIQDTLPDLENLFFDVMIGAESHLPDLIDELKTYIENAHGHEQIFELFKAIIAYLIKNLGKFCHIVYLLATASSLLLYLLLLILGVPFKYELPLAFHVIFAAGFSLTKFDSLDFWPKLGAAWKIRDSSITDKLTEPKITRAHQDSECTVKNLEQQISSWLDTMYKSLFILLLRFCFFIIPGVTVLQRANMTMVGVAVFLFGFVIPLLSSKSLRYIQKLFYREQGMSEYEMDRTTRFFDFIPPIAAVGKWIIHRRLLESAIRIFISHAWKDDENWEKRNLIPPPEKLYQIITASGIPCFLDKRIMPGKFTAWRSQIVENLLECTHFFVILDRNAVCPQRDRVHKKIRITLRGGVHKEIRTTLQRWYTDLEPSIICIVETDFAAKLDKHVLSRELEFLLHKCPKLTYEEASKPDVVAHLIRQRRRQGLFKDWITLVFPFAMLKRIVHIETSSTSKLL